MSSSVLGGPYNGHSAKQTITSYKSGEEATSRSVLRKGWNTENAQDSINGNKRVITPFRAVNNLGDYLSRQNYVCGGPNQVNASKPGLRGRIGSIISNCDNTGVDAASCNPKFVSDSSDYTRFKKQQSTVRNYNDVANGGDQSNASYVNLMRVRR